MLAPFKTGGSPFTVSGGNPTLCESELTVLKVSLKRATWIGLASAGALMALSALPSMSALAATAPTTLFVSTTGSDTSGTGTVSAPYQTISHAIAVAAPGDKILVEPGTYAESLNITQKVEIEADAGDGANATNTIINATGDSNGVTISGSAADGTMIKGLTVENADNHGIFVVNSDNVVITEMVATQDGINADAKIAEDKAIELVGTAHDLVVDNTVTANGQGGIGVADNGVMNPGAPTPMGTAAPALDNIVEGNTISNSGKACGIVVASYNTNEGVLDTIVSDNSVSTSPAGIVVAADTPDSSAIGNVVIDNTAFNNSLPGVILHSNAPGDIVSNNSVIGNTVYGNLADPEVKADSGPTGIIAIGVVTPVTHSLISGNQVSGETYGIYLANSPGVLGLTDNTFLSDVKVPITPANPSTEFPLLPTMINTYNQFGFFYAGHWPGGSNMVAIAKYGKNGMLMTVYAAPYSAGLSQHLGSLANGNYVKAGQYQVSAN